MALEDLKVQHYFLGGGAEHSAEQVRRLVYGHQQGAEGICTLSDLRVQPLAIPGGGVAVMIGSAFIVSRYAGAVREMYFGTVTQEQTVTIPPNTDEDESRSDLIVMRVKDPFVQGSPWTDPAAGVVGDGEESDEERAAIRAAAQYVFIERIPSVPAGTTRLQQVVGYENDTALTLARVDLPAITGTVIDDHIVNLRYVHTPRERTRPIHYALSGAEVNAVSATSAWPDGGQTWPAQAEHAGELELDIPSWASHAAVEVTFYGVLYPGGDAWGSVWLQIGATANPANVKSQDSRWDSDGVANPSRATLGFADTIAIPAVLRGTRQKFYPRASRFGGSPEATARMDRVSSIAIKVTFQERA
jgi:hypothetical protein